MALITCSNCGKQMSDKAPVCPHCGASYVPDDPVYPDTETTDGDSSSFPTSLIAVAALVVVALLGGGGYYLYSLEQEKQRAEFVRDSLAQVERARIAAEEARIAAEQARQDSIRAAHEIIVNGYLEAVRTTNQKVRNDPDNYFDGEYVGSVSYFLKDFTQDGTPELLVATSFDLGEGMMSVDVYGYRNGSVEKIQEIGGVNHYGNNYLLSVEFDYNSSGDTYNVYKYTWTGSRFERSFYKQLSGFYNLKEPSINWINHSNEQPILNMF